MRILFVAMSDSIHTARWINQLEGQGWDLHLFPSLDVGATHPDLKKVTVYHSFYTRQQEHGRAAIDPTVKLRGIPVLSPRPYHAAFAARIAMGVVRPNRRADQLRRLVKKLRPDIIHSMEIQAAGYLTLAARERYQGEFPPWIVTNWGSDIYLFGRLAAHAERIKSVLAACTHYSCECQRDVGAGQGVRFQGRGAARPAEHRRVQPGARGAARGRCAALEAPDDPAQGLHGLGRPGPGGAACRRALRRGPAGVPGGDIRGDEGAGSAGCGDGGRGQGGGGAGVPVDRHTGAGDRVAARTRRCWAGTGRPGRTWG